MTLQQLSQIMQTVYQIKIFDGSGTCFSLSFDNRKFLITAKHIIPSNYQNNVFAEKLPIEIYSEQGWEGLLYSRIIYSKNPYLDIVAIEITNDHNINFLSFPYTAHNIILATDIFFLGYPYGYSNTSVQGVPRTLPLIKKALISGTAYDKGKEGHSIGFLLDGHNNRGFSGGPCISITPNSQIFGVTVSYIPQPDIVFDKDGKEKMIIYENSGLFTCHSIDLILEAIREN